MENIAYQIQYVETNADLRLLFFEVCFVNRLNYWNSSVWILKLCINCWRYTIFNIRQILEGGKNGNPVGKHTGYVKPLTKLMFRLGGRLLRNTVSQFVTPMYLATLIKTFPKSPPPQHVHMNHHRREHRPSVSRSPTFGSRVNDESLRCLN